MELQCTTHKHALGSVKQLPNTICPEQTYASAISSALAIIFNRLNQLSRSSAPKAAGRSTRNMVIPDLCPPLGAHQAARLVQPSMPQTERNQGNSWTLHDTEGGLSQSLQ
ncbi:hypothetical protein KIL84_007781 [Mauremys mutica]|uniref:Uncharacterized protein n=1 Tax=Mauremys mutica TaxID=74926 RepID=A0A9D3X3C8_9SAUR|nr:hypothetical protein KIL84_007781 [Mauremys mutica]